MCALVSVCVSAYVCICVYASVRDFQPCSHADSSHTDCSASFHRLSGIFINHGIHE